MKMFTASRIFVCLSLLLNSFSLMANEDHNIPVASQYFTNIPLLLPELKTVEPDKVILTAKVLEKQKVKISWITPAAYKSSVFVVQKSKDLKKFEDIASADANFDPNQRSLYSYTDEDRNKGSFYYRLVEHKEDGTIKVFEPILVTLETQQTANNAKVTIETIAQSQQNIHIYDVFNTDAEVMLTKGTSEMGVVATFKQIDDKEIVLTPNYDLSPGEYTVKVRSNGVVKKYKFTVQENEITW